MRQPPGPIFVSAPFFRSGRRTSVFPPPTFAEPARRTGSFPELFRAASAFFRFPNESGLLPF